MDGLTASEMKELETRMQKRQVKEFVGVSLANTSHPLSTIQKRREGKKKEKKKEKEKPKERRESTKPGTLTPPAPPMQLFSNLVDHCFMSCIDDFTSKSLSSRETGCVARCVQKDMAAAQRLGERFQEHNAAQMANQQR
ncbi:hypothetical protein RB595_001247 [Gaeumannomyces hyphopodioides]